MIRTLIFVCGLLLGTVTPLHSDDDTDALHGLSVLAAELQRLRQLNAKIKKADPQHGKYRFRYELMDARLHELLMGIQAHQQAVIHAEKLERLTLKR